MQPGKQQRQDQQQVKRNSAQHAEDFAFAPVRHVNAVDEFEKRALCLGKGLRINLPQELWVAAMRARLDHGLRSGAHVTWQQAPCPFDSLGKRRSAHTERRLERGAKPVRLGVDVFLADHSSGLSAKERSLNAAGAGARRRSALAVLYVGA